MIARRRYGRAMADLTCVDGSRLGVRPEPVLDRRHVPYEVTLRLSRDGAPFGVVGERCGYFLAGVGDRLAAARGDDSPQGARWALADRFPASAAEVAVRAWAGERGDDTHATWDGLSRYLPRDRELFAFRRRDPDDLASVGELRCVVETEKAWVSSGGLATGRAPALGPGRWRLVRRAVVDAWGDGGVGVRAVLDSSALAGFLTELLGEMAGVGATFASALLPAATREAHPAIG
jgi:hypothetical protein